MTPVDWVDALPMLGWTPFLHPIALPPGVRLWFLPPLLICVALVYRATRARTPRDVLRATPRTFVTILLGMAAIALGAFGIHLAVLYFTTV